MDTSDNNPNEVIPGYPTMEAFTKASFLSLMESTKASNIIPQEQSWDLYTAYPAFITAMDKIGDKTLQIMARVLKHQGLPRNIHRRDLDEKFEVVVEANDSVLERVGGYLDDMSGISRNPVPVLVETSITAPPVVNSPGTGSWNKTDFSIDRRPLRLLTAKNIERPQVMFKDKIDNNNDHPFQPRILEKPNSLKPLALFMEYNEDGIPEGYTHPYDFELENLIISPEQLEIVPKPIEPKPIAQTPLIYVDTEKELNSMLRDLMAVSEIAVDLEHHSYRTFQGITCLMQISTRTCDYIIDTILLRDKLWMLNEVFTKSSIVKIFHGADNDIEWLQRDLSLYVVNMFDSHIAAKQLSHARVSLAYLLKHYCNLDINKHFQLADWRIRPLPKELISYARSDTHYLLYIYDVMKNELIEQANGNKNILESVLQRCTDLCKKRYIKPKYLPDSHMEMYRKSKRMFDNRQLYALGELYKWRDTISRQEDESTGHVLPNHMLLQISESLPREMQGVLACCNPIPPLVRQNLVFLHQIVVKAREQSLIKPVLEEEIRTRGPTQHSNTIDLEGPLHCPHDLSKEPEFRDDLPTLLVKVLDNSTLENNDKMSKLAVNVDVDFIKNDNYKAAKSSISVFNTPETTDDEELSETISKLKRITFVSPYDRYRIVMQTNEEENRKSEVASKTDEGIARIKEHFNVLNACANTIERSESSETTMTSAPAQLANTETETINENVVIKKLEDEILSLRAQLKKRKREERESESEISDKPTTNKIENENNNKQNKKQNKRSRNNNNSNNQESGINYQNNRHYSNNSKLNLDRSNVDKRNRDAAPGFQGFDYSSVDFKRFKGGSAVTPKPDNLKTKYKGKGKNNKFTGKNNNKSFSYKGNAASGSGKR